ncbi:MAG: hypothetical protein KF908_05055, partial [Nitrosomonas sp.]|nr:hypothetical protein [Nitrosomonas sp.]
FFFSYPELRLRSMDNWIAIEEFHLAREHWFTELLGLEHGIPTHDTDTLSERCMRLLNPPDVVHQTHCRFLNTSV